MSYIGNVLIAVDQMFNAFMGGWADETISARAYRQSNDKKHWEYARIGIDWLFEHIIRQGPGHCKAAFRAEQLRRHSPVEQRITK